MRDDAWDHRDDYYGGMYGWGGYGWGAANWWAPVAWSGVTGFLGGMAGAAAYGAFDEEPVSYSYESGGSSETIIVNNTPQDAAAYGQEAATIATSYEEKVAPPEPAVSVEQPQETSAATPPVKWTPLGIYALSESELGDQTPTKHLQLAINQAGAIGGTYLDTQSNTKLTIEGAIDQQSQRAAWYVGDDTSTIVETGLFNLTQSETPVLIHRDGKTTQAVLVRIQPPAGQQ